MAGKDYTEPNICIDENLSTDAAGLPILQPWAFPRVVADTIAMSSGDGTLFATETLPGKLLIEAKLGWLNETPLQNSLIIRVVRGPKTWITSNPNAIQFRDRYTYIQDLDNLEPSLPIETSQSVSKAGSAIDVGTNSVAEPNPGRHYRWASASCADEIVGPILPNEHFNLWYRCYVWTPPPFSDNANKNNPKQEAYAYWTRIMLIALPEQGNLVTG